MQAIFLIFVLLSNLLIMKHLLFMLTMFVGYVSYGQCNQQVFSSVGAEYNTAFQYQDCDGWMHYFTMPTGGYTVILCAEFNQAWVNAGDGMTFPLQNEHPAYASCIEPEPCLGDFDNDGVVDVADLLTFLEHFDTPCD